MLLEVIAAMKFSVSIAVSLSTVRRRLRSVSAAAAEASSTARWGNKLHSTPDGRKKILVINLNRRK